MSAVSRAVRLLALLRLLGAHPAGLTTREIAERLGVSPRTVQRDLIEVQAEPLYAPLWQDDGYRWRIMTGYDMM
jgi:predicted DNA-binding transcriptional regulator YafY